MPGIILLMSLLSCAFANVLHYEQEFLTFYDVKKNITKKGFKFTSIETDNKAQTLKVESTETDEKMHFIAKVSNLIRKTNSGWILIDLQHKENPPIKLKSSDKNWPIQNYSYSFKHNPETTHHISVERMFSKMRAKVDVHDWKGILSGTIEIEGKHIHEADFLSRIRNITSVAQ